MDKTNYRITTKHDKSVFLRGNTTGKSTSVNVNI